MYKRPGYSLCMSLVFAPAFCGAEEEKGEEKTGETTKENHMEIARMKTVILGGLALMPVAEQKKRLEKVLTTEGNRTTINTPELKKLIQDCAALTSIPLADAGSWFTQYFAETDGSSIVEQDDASLTDFGSWLENLKEKVDRQ